MIEKHVHDFKRVILVLQGGGSLGAYHVGAYKALAEAGYLPDVICGISIGSITAAILAGNAPKDRLAKIQEFWDMVCWPSPLEEILGYKIPKELRRMHNQYASTMSLLYGQPNFFYPRIPPPQFQAEGSEGATSYYDTSVLKDTLRRCCDFERINQNKTRLIVGATKVKTGELEFFDSAEIKMKPEHIMASSALPPWMPGIHIDDELYWDGGVASNSPIESIFQVKPYVKTLVFMIDLFNPQSLRNPLDIQEVEWIRKNIAYSSRTTHHLRDFSEKHNLKHGIFHLLKHIPPELQSDPAILELKNFASENKLHFIHLVYHAPDTETFFSDYEFSRTSIKERSQHGYEDMENALSQKHWLEPQPSHIGSKIHTYHYKRS
jgi:NTE family protein